MLRNKEKIYNILKALYKDSAGDTLVGLIDIINKYQSIKNETQQKWLDQNDSILITYADTINEADESSIKVLSKFLHGYVKQSISAIHLLPFYTFSSDDGFSVIDYKKVRKDIGSWEDIEQLSEDYDLMFDAVINHISKESYWFKAYLEGNETYKNFFIECDESQDLSKVTRPRALPLLTEFDTAWGKRKVWTTFSSDQIDINYKEPKVLLEIIDLLLMYISKGARYIRLDAIGFLWKEIGTTCMHLPETHQVIKLMRLVIEEIDDTVAIITETNTPHKENISYFGKNFDEAHMVYQFSLPPLTLHAFIEKDSTVLLKWFENIKRVSSKCTYFNFLASHDGIGLRPLEGILSDESINRIVDTVLNRGGKVSYRNLKDGSKKPYELNINYLDAICESDLDIDMKVDKFIASQAILLSVIGVPGIYIHSLIGSQNDLKGVIESGINRRINREKLDKDELLRELDSNDTLRAKVLNRYLELLNIRKKHTAFSPNANQEVMFIDKKLFSIKRVNELTGEEIKVMINLTYDRINIIGGGVNLITNKEMPISYNMKPYEVVWQIV